MAEINEERVADHKARLLDRYDDVERRETEFRMPDSEFPEHREYARDGYIGAAYAWIVRTPEQAPPLSASMAESDADDADRVLCILHRGATHWDIPGGGHEGEEFFAETAVREVREETAITCEVTDLLLLEHEVTVADGYDDRLHTLWAYFGAEYRGGSLSIQHTELNGAAWFRERPPKLKDNPATLADKQFE
jgi:8-oxo-dGTP pyrophosphatase MutT (NUDIX family)